METTENNTTATNQEKQSQSTQNENPKMVIEITRYKGIVNAFNNPRSLAKLIIVIALIIVIVFGGITGIALVIKNYYPYKTVNSNEYGATIIQNEDNEVIYWLFNSAELWANSGIHVKKGDVISVRASGAFHTAIHHLVKDAEKNKMSHKWLNPIGGPNSSDDKDNNRSAFRISPTASFNKMLMQVIPESVDLKDEKGDWRMDMAPYIDGRARNDTTPDIYAIGSERDKITIRKDGVLYFTVNDIALTKNIICQMKDLVNKCDTGDFQDIGDLHLGGFPMPPDVKMENRYRDYKENMKKGLEALEVDKGKDIFGKKGGWILGYRGLYNKVKNTNKIDSNYLKKNFTELDYYLITNFMDAWFVDNAGSFLIVIERKKQQ